MSGVNIAAIENRPAISIRKGAAENIRHLIESQGGTYPPAVAAAVEEISRQGGTPLAVAEGHEVLGVIRLKGRG